VSEYGIDNWHGKEVFTLATEKNVVAMKKAGAVLERDVKTHFTSTKGKHADLMAEGRTAIGRQRNKRGSYTKFHHRSLPGEPPAVDTGVLRASIIHQTTAGLVVEGKVGPDIEHIRAETPAGTDVEYGFYLELGTANMAARPYLRPALIRTRKIIKKIFVKANS